VDPSVETEPVVFVLPQPASMVRAKTAAIIMVIILFIFNVSFQTTVFIFATGIILESICKIQKTTNVKSVSNHLHCKNHKKIASARNRPPGHFNALAAVN
jgi:hypothetical protein